MRPVSLSSLLLLALVCMASPAEARKLFISELRVAPTCVSVSPEALLALIAQQIPRDVLDRRGLTYEDVPSYLAVQQWNPASFPVRQSQNILRRLHQFDMQYMLWLELSCLPSDSGARYMLTGRLTNLDVMDTILSCPATQAGSNNGRRTCNTNGQVFDAVSFTSVELPNFDSFPAAVRELLARLLHVPELQLGSLYRVFAPSEEIDVPFLVRRNDGTEPGYSGPPAPVRGYRMRQDVVQVPADLFSEVCRAPQLRWNQIACAGGFADAHCDAADRVPLQVRTLIHREVPARAVEVLPTQTQGGDRVVFRAPSHDVHYVLRAEAIADETGGEVHSTPVFACLRVRERPRQFGFAGRLGVGLDALRGYREGTYPGAPAAILPLPFGIDLLFAQHLFGTGTVVFPNNRLVLSAGFTYVHGVYPCTRWGSGCNNPPEIPGSAPNHVSTSYAIETRAQYQAELFRIAFFAPFIFAELGLGAELLSSTPTSFANDGWHGLFLSGVGGGLQLHLGRVNSVATRVWIGAHWQTRMRFPWSSAPLRLPNNQLWFDQAGVPDLVQMLWFTIGTTLTAERPSRELP